MKQYPYTGILLAGGKSSRMGENKALLKIKNHTLIEYILSIMSEVVRSILLIANDKESYRFLGVPIFSDIYADCGPMGGLHAGLKHSPSPVNLVLACDIPLIEADSLRRLLSLASSEKHDIVLPRTSDGRMQPLCAVYKRTCLPILERCLEARRLKLENVYGAPDLHVKTVTCDELKGSDAMLTNINTPAEYQALKEFFLRKDAS